MTHFFIWKYKTYDINHYVSYDLKRQQIILFIEKAFVSFVKYDSYLLFMKLNLSHIESIFISDVRIDDLTISHVIDKMKISVLHRNWSADLDKTSMIRATWMFFDNAIKMYVTTDQTDIDEEIIQQRHEDYYYKWWRDLHCLMS